MESPKFCRYCGARLGVENARFCQVCGKEQALEQPAPVSAQAPSLDMQGNQLPNMPGTQEPNQTPMMQGNQSQTQPLNAQGMQAQTQPLNAQGNQGQNQSQPPLMQPTQWLYQPPNTQGSTPSPNTQEGQEPKRSHLVYILGGIGAALGIIALVFFIFTFLSGREGNQSAGANTKRREEKASLDLDAEGDNEAAEEGDEAAEDGTAGSAENTAAEDGEPAEEDIVNENAEEVSVAFMSADVSDYPEVKLYVSVEDDDGESIELYSPTAKVRERISGGEEIERTVRKIERLEGNQGISIDIVADKSGSMQADLPKMQSIMIDFVNSLDYGADGQAEITTFDKFGFSKQSKSTSAGDRAEIITFDSYIMYMCTYTNEPELLRGGISNMVADGNTALYDALIEGIENAGGQQGAGCVIGFTDGYDNASVHSYEEVIALAQSLQVPVYIIGTNGADAGILELIAEGTGGRYWLIDTITDMQALLNEIYTIEKEQYCVVYESDSHAEAYQERTVSCGIQDTDYTGKIEEVTFTPRRSWEEAEHESRYELVAADVSWSEANRAAIRRGGHLATITSENEMELLSKLGDQADIRYLWIGGYTSIRNGQAFGHWVTGEPFSYTAWREGEPSRNDQDGEAEMCLMLWKVNDEWSWNDQRDDLIGAGLKWFIGNIGYIIEYED